jgi:hypothetical protein
LAIVSKKKKQQTQEYFFDLSAMSLINSNRPQLAKRADTYIVKHSFLPCKNPSKKSDVLCTYFQLHKKNGYSVASSTMQLSNCHLRCNLKEAEEEKTKIILN